jgi:predicted transcriptional regulator
MIDLHSASTPLTVQLPADLVVELQRLARDRQTTVDALVQDACLSVVESHVWEDCYRAWERSATPPATPRAAS